MSARICSEGCVVACFPMKFLFTLLVTTTRYWVSSSSMGKMFSITCGGVCGLSMSASRVRLLGWVRLRVSNVFGGVLGLLATRSCTSRWSDVDIWVSVSGGVLGLIAAAACMGRLFS